MVTIYLSLGCKPKIVHQLRIWHGAAIITIRIKARSLSTDPTKGKHQRGSCGHSGKHKIPFQVLMVVSFRYRIFELCHLVQLHQSGRGRH